MVLLTFNVFKRQLYNVNDWLRLKFTKKRDLLMIDGGNECAQNNKGDP